MRETSEESNSPKEVVIGEDGDIVIQGGTQDERRKVGDAARRVFSTRHGQKALRVLRGRDKPLELRLNREGRNQAPVPGDFADINTDPTKQKTVLTTKGRVPTTLERAIAHEAVGHAIMGTPEEGPGLLDNIIKNENPIMRELGQPDRIE